MVRRANAQLPLSNSYPSLAFADSLNPSIPFANTFRFARTSIRPPHSSAMRLTAK